ncbi:hypothetical protein RhiirC2_795137 [Rhizophagus irregularis]|uniref:Uncharacterized protein n=1 Tax=Rhizophagus irregularis TaxID=588596 RepID=A0A2N1MC59_9GLOM|nr:hypothetical protein RhiirC2_795137 [Rhizophagus irregularis]
MDSPRLELEQARDDLSSKKYELECMEKGIESSNNIFKREIDALSLLPGWLSDDLRPLVYELSLENKVMEFDKSFARENILEALQELLP